MNIAESGGLELRSVPRVISERMAEILTVRCLRIFAVTAYAIRFLLSRPCSRAARVPSVLLPSTKDLHLVARVVDLEERVDERTDEWRLVAAGNDDRHQRKIWTHWKRKLCPARFGMLGNGLPGLGARLKDHPAIVPILAAVIAACSPVCAADDAFYAPVSDSGAGLPADGIYPRGRKLAFMGYSGDPARDLVNGFTAAGPVYVNQMSYLRRCFQNGWPVVAHIGPAITFNDTRPEKHRVDEAVVKKEIGEQVRSLAIHEEIIWWAVLPEELRPWRGDEMKYLSIVSKSIRKNDPLGRPIYAYNPNHSDSRSLVPIAKRVDILAKGCYVNFSGHKRDRAWVRRCLKQEVDAIRAVKRPEVVPLMMPELWRDPKRAEGKEIRDWVRHDIYLGMASGARGVLIWSLFKRKGVFRTWQLWYDAYSECARELNGDRGLARVFLFGERRNSLHVKLAKGGDATSVTAAEFAYGDSRWLFIVNSANTPSNLTVAGWPEDSQAEDAFDGKPLSLNAGVALRVHLRAYGVAAFRFNKGGAQAK